MFSRKLRQNVHLFSKKGKEDFLTAPNTAIKLDPTTSVRKNVTKLKVHEKNTRTVIEIRFKPRP